MLELEGGAGREQSLYWVLSDQVQILHDFHSSHRKGQD